MTDSFDDVRRYGDDLNEETGTDEYGMTTYAVSRSWSMPIILVGGLLTTAIVFVAHYFISLYTGHNLLTLLANFVIPIGALIGGLIAGIGYAVSARIVQFYPKRSFFFFILLLQFFLFFVARYMEYSVYCYHFDQRVQALFDDSNSLKFFENAVDENGNKIEMDMEKFKEEFKKSIKDQKPSSFTEYYRYTIEETEWVSKTKKDEPFKMGKWGWAIEFITAFVFAISSLAALGILSWAAYCRRCRRFMSKRLEFSFPMRAPKRKIKKNDEADLEAFRQEEVDALDHALAKVARIEAFLKSEQVTNRPKVFEFLCELRDEVAAEAKPIKGAPNSVRILYSECGSCNNFRLRASVEILNVNDKTAFQNAEFLNYTDGKFVTVVNFEEVKQQQQQPSSEN
ncbi:MAG: hypothetical protein LBL39_03065 [Planctomycetaceae bacterium]|jgi:hypothetical protein|nr:hypothetical protein [Planctomycetaceae bacterium]